MGVTIWVARHGQTLDNELEICTGQTRDPALTQLGQEQARQRGSGLLQNDQRFIAVYTSPLLRAKHTAEIIARVLGLPEVVTIDDLKERFVGSMFETGRGVHMDILTSTVRDEIEWLQTQPLEVALDYRFDATPDAETIREASSRFKCALWEIASRQHEGEKVLAISHSALMGSMLIEMGKMAPAFNKNPFGSASIPNLEMMKFLVDGEDINYLG